MHFSIKYQTIIWVLAFNIFFPMITFAGSLEDFAYIDKCIYSIELYSIKLRSDYKTTYKVAFFDTYQSDNDFSATLISDCQKNMVGILTLKRGINSQYYEDKNNLYAEKMSVVPKNSQIGIFHDYACKVQKRPQATTSFVVNGGNINWQPYLKEMERRMYAAPKVLYTKYYLIPDPKTAKVLYRISRDGYVVSAKLLQSKGNNYLDIDQNLLQVKGPLSPLPKRYTKPYVDIEFHDDYTVKEEYYRPVPKTMGDYQ